MRKKRLLLLLFVLNIYIVRANTYYLNTDYIRYMKKGGFPSSYKGEFILLEFTDDNQFNAYSAVQIEYQTFFLDAAKKCFYADEVLKKCEGKILPGSDPAFLSIKRTGGSGKAEPISFIMTHSSSGDAQVIVDSINKLCLSGIFDIRLLEEKGFKSYSSVFLSNNGTLIKDNNIIGQKHIYTFIDCGKYYNGIVLEIEGKKYDFTFVKSNNRNIDLFEAPSKPCDKRKRQRTGTLIKLK